MTLVVAALREAPWLTARRLRDYSTMLIAAYVAAAAWALTGDGINDPAHRPIGTDFLSFWTVSSALHDGHEGAIYAPEALARLEQRVDPQAIDAQSGRPYFFAWAYPPPALLIVYPLALLPYLWSLAAWLGLGLAGYLTALWRIAPRHLTLWAGFAFPAVFVTASHGQNSLLTAALLGWALLLLPARPRAAGMLIGLLAFKPQLGLLMPLALAAGGHWRAIAWATLSVFALAVTSLALFGAEIWSGFAASLPAARAMLEQGLVPHYKLQSIFAAVRLLGGPVPLAYALQGAAGLAAACVTVWTWRQPVRQELKSAVLITASLLATPFVLDYDLTMLAFPLAWLAVSSLPDRALPWERTTLAVVYFVPIASRVMAEATHVLAAPVAEFALLLVLLARIGAEAPGALVARGAAQTRARGTAVS